jgi:hypothetical protein
MHFCVLKVFRLADLEASASGEQGCLAVPVACLEGGVFGGAERGGGEGQGMAAGAAACEDEDEQTGQLILSRSFPCHSCGSIHREA